MKTTSSTFGTCAVLLACASFSCRQQTTSATAPDYRATPTALSFSACPTKDDTGAAVPDVYPDTQKVTVANDGKAAGGLKLTISGTDAALFSVVNPPTAVGGNDSADVAIAFSPQKRSDFKATLTIDDQFEGTPDVTVTLSGEGKNLPATATLETAPQAADGTTFTTCEQFFLCEAAFPDTLFTKTVTRQIKLRNKGCPALKITGLTIGSGRGDTQGFTIVEPATLPSASSPLLLSTADGTDEVTITVAFSPTDDGSGNNGRDAYLAIASNDAANPDYRIALTGQGVKPSAYVTPSSCDFSSPTDACGYPTKTADHAHFRISNDGNAAVKIASTTFKSTGSQTSGVNNRFTIGTALTGSTIAPGSSATLEVVHTLQPLYVTDQLEVKVVLASDGTTEVGNVTLALFGGSKPCLTTEPLDTVNFNNPTADETTQTLTIKNGANCGTLTVKGVTIDSSPFFKLGTPSVAANTEVAPGASVTAGVVYKKPASGGMQLGTLRIASNDSDYGAAKLVQLLSQSPLDEIPIAELRGCTPAQLSTDAQCMAGATSSMSVSLAGVSPKRITLSGVTSYDPVPSMPGQKRAATKYRFTLLQPLPSGVTGLALANNDTQVTTPTAELTLGTATNSPALYRIGLVVFDDHGQASTPSTININVSP